MTILEALDQVRENGGVLYRKRKPHQTIVVDPSHYKTPFFWWRAWDRTRRFWQCKKWVPIVDDIVADDWVIQFVWAAPETAGRDAELAALPPPPADEAEPVEDTEAA